MLRMAGPGDEAKIEGFLARHAETSMFLRANLARYGLANREAPHATADWLAGADGITAVLGLSNARDAMMQAPGAAPELFATFAAKTAGREGQYFAEHGALHFARIGTDGRLRDRRRISDFSDMTFERLHAPGDRDDETGGKP